MWKKLPCYSRDASASCSKSVQLRDCCSKKLPASSQFGSIAGTTRPPRVARGDRTHLRPRVLWPTQTVDRTGELHRYGLRWTVTSWAFTEKVNAIAWRQSQLGRRISGDVGGHPRRAVGLLVGSHRITAARLSSSATVTSTVLQGVPCGLSRYTATADGLNSATADSPATASGPLCRQHAIAVRGSADQVQPGEPRTEPATDYRQNRCSRAGFDDLSGLEHEHPVGVGEHMEVVGDQHRGASVTGQHQRPRHAEQQAERSARPGGLEAQYERRRRRLTGDQRQKCGHSTLLIELLSCRMRAEFLRLATVQ